MSSLRMWVAKRLQKFASILESNSPEGRKKEEQGPALHEAEQVPITGKSPKIGKKEFYRRVTVLAVQYALGEGPEVQGCKIFTTNSGSRSLKFFSGDAQVLNIVEQNPKKDSWSAKAVREGGWVIWWIFYYQPTTDVCQTCKGEKVTLYNNEWRPCLNCHGSGRALKTAYTNYLVVRRPGEKDLINIHVNQLKHELGVEPDTRPKQEQQSAEEIVG